MEFGGGGAGEVRVKTKKALNGRSMDIFLKTQLLPIMVHMVNNKLCLFSSQQMFPKYIYILINQFTVPVIISHIKKS